MVDSDFLRIEATKIEKLNELISELSLAISGIIHHPEINPLQSELFEQSVHRLELILQETQDLTSNLNLVPLKNIFAKMNRLVRELEKQTGKEVDLIIEGEEIAIDKRIAVQLYNPNVHIIRNAIDHGIESKEERLKKGKTPRGIIKIKGIQQGTEIKIMIEDNGRGLNREKILHKAIEKGIVTPDHSLSDDEVWQFIFESNFSTAEHVSNISGRGMGMDVVHTGLKKLHGNIKIKSRKSEGTSILMKVPMTLTFLNSIIVKIHDYCFAIPVNDMVEIITSGTTINHSIINLRDEFIPILDIKHFYQKSNRDCFPNNQLFFIIQSSQGKFALPITEILGKQQVTMHPAKGILNTIRGSAGCAILNDGTIALALDCEALIQNE